MTTAELLTAFVIAAIPFIPTEPVLVGLGVLLASADASPLVLIAVASVGCSISDHVLYLLGRVAGGRALGRLRSRRSGAAALDWLTRNVTRWGAPVLVAGRWVPAGGTVGAVFAGLLHWRVVRFTPASLVGSALWATYATMLGYLGGAATDQPVFGFVLSLAVATSVGLATSALVRRAQRRSDDERSSALSQGRV